MFITSAVGPCPGVLERTSDGLSIRGLLTAYCPVVAKRRDLSNGEAVGGIGVAIELLYGVSGFVNGIKDWSGHGRKELAGFLEA